MLGFCSCARDRRLEMKEQISVNKTEHETEFKTKKIIIFVVSLVIQTIIKPVKFPKAAVPASIS